MPSAYDWRPFHDFWFPPDIHADDGPAHRARFVAWFAGGMNAELPRFAPLLDAARAGALDDWGETVAGRLSLIVLLDQVPRGLFAGAAEAFACDGLALRQAKAMLKGGQYDALRWPWERTFVVVATGHAEGPDHLARMDRAVALGAAIARECPEIWRPIYDHSARQAAAHREVIARFGRFPHRNAALGRTSTPKEAAYIATGNFVHLRRPPEV